MRLWRSATKPLVALLHSGDHLIRCQCVAFLLGQRLSTYRLIGDERDETARTDPSSARWTPLGVVSEGQRGCKMLTAISALHKKTIPALSGP